MAKLDLPPLDPKLDLEINRVVDVPPALVWKAWTEPKHLMQWFTPKPWQTIKCEIDLRPGGKFLTVMRSPEGQDQPPGVGCYLEVIPEKRLSWTSVLLPGFRPATNLTGEDCHAMHFTAIVAMAPEGKGTHYIARALHPDADGAKKHADMGFHDGWGTVTDQMVDYMKAQ